MGRTALRGLVIAAVLTAAAPADADGRPSCGGFADRLASNDLVRIVETRTGAVRACWRATGRSARLSTRGQDFRLGQLSGRSVAYSVFDNEDYIYLSVRRMDVRTRRLRVDVAATSYQASESVGGVGGARVDGVRLARSGVAWVAYNPRLPDERWEVFYVRGGTLRRDPTRVALSPTYELGSFAVGRNLLYWSTGAGSPQRAAY